MSSTSGFGSASDQRLSTSRSTPFGPAPARTPGQTPASDSSRSVVRARIANSERMARIASLTFSRAAWASSTLAYTQRYSPASPPFSRSRNARRAEVLPVWARCVEDEVALVPDQGQHVVEVEAAERRDAVVLLRADRTRGVEEAHGRQYLTSGERARHRPGRECEGSPPECVPPLIRNENGVRVGLPARWREPAEQWGKPTLTPFSIRGYAAGLSNPGRELVARNQAPRESHVTRTAPTRHAVSGCRALVASLCAGRRCGRLPCRPHAPCCTGGGGARVAERGRAVAAGALPAHRPPPPVHPVPGGAPRHPLRPARLRERGALVR